MTNVYLPLYQDLTLAAHRAYDRGLQAGTGGNLSIRIPGQDAIIVKSSGGSFGDSEETGRGWTAISFAGESMEGETETPTREWRLHAALQRSLPQIAAVIHTHSVYTVSWSQRHCELPLTTWQSCLKLQVPIPVLDIPSAMVPDEAISDILGLFEANPTLPGFILRGHGLVALGKTATDAEHIAELMEETAHVTILEYLLGRD